MTAVAWILRQMGVVDTLDAMLTWDRAQCNLSPGTRLLALILCALFDRTALSRVERIFARQDIPVLLGPGVQARDLNDDALGRALDKLAQARPATVFHTVAAKVWDHERVLFDILHGDTTAVALYGEYASAAPDALQIVRGYSKDHRPDLKQVGMGLVANSEGIPWLGDVHDGNLNDTVWNAQGIGDLQRLLPEETLRSILYTALCRSRDYADPSACRPRMALALGGLRGPGIGVARGIITGPPGRREAGQTDDSARAAPKPGCG